MLRPGQAIALCVLALLMLGVVMVNSAGMSVDARDAVTIESILLSRSTIYMALAVAAMLGVGLLPIRSFVARYVEVGEPATGGEERAGPGRSLTEHVLRLWPLWVAVLALVAGMATVYLPGIGKEVNHSHRWINLHLPGLDSVQPSELGKWGLIVVMAWYCTRNARRMGSFWYGLIPGLAAAGAVAGFIVLEDLGTGALVGLVAAIMLVAAGARLWHLALLAPIPLAGLAAAIITNPYRIHRITSFLDPYQDAQGKGYHMIQSMVAVANGQFFGRGLGHGLQKFGYLPEDTTDFLFAIVCEELGVFGAALVIFLYGALLWCVLSVIRREPSRFLKLVGLGVMATVGLQALINLAVVTGLGPTKGIALPLLSSGGTGWILTAASLGLVIAMDRSQGVMQWYRVADQVRRGDLSPNEAEPAWTPPPMAAGRGTPIFAPSPGPGSHAPTPPPPDDTRFAPPPLETPVAAMLVDADEAPTSRTLVEPEPDAVAASTLLTTVEPGQTVVYPLLTQAAEAPARIETPDAAAAPVGETGLLFPAADAPAAPAARVVITDDARDWPDATRLRPA